MVGLFHVEHVIGLEHLAIGGQRIGLILCYAQDNKKESIMDSCVGGFLLTS